MNGREKIVGVDAIKELQLGVIRSKLWLKEEFSKF